MVACVRVLFTSHVTIGYNLCKPYILNKTHIPLSPFYQIRLFSPYFSNNLKLISFLFFFVMVDYHKIINIIFYVLACE